jgi:hypothetical protein
MSGFSLIASAIATASQPVALAASHAISCYRLISAKRAGFELVLI